MPVKRTSNSKGGPDALAVLKRDHEKVKGLLKKLQNAKDRDTQRNIFAQIDNALQMHTRVEEEIFYPAFKAAVKGPDRELFFEAVEEHHVVDLILPEMRTTTLTKDMFAAKVKVLQDIVEHHIEEEERRMFPKAHNALDAHRLADLGKRIQMREDQISVGMLDQSLAVINPYASRTYKPMSRQTAGRAAAKKRAA